MRMYRCCNVKRFLILLLCDAIALLLLTILLRGGAEAEVEGISVPILMYHSVHEERTGAYIVSPKTLEQDLAYLSAHDYHAVFVEDLIAYVYDGKPLPDHPVVITFDDGFYNNFSAALPLLEQYDMRATISVVGSFMEAQADADSHHPAYSYLTAADIRALCDSGRIEIGNHTYAMHGNQTRHGCAILPNEREAAYAQVLRQDVGQLQSLLTAQAGVTPVVFAYPFGFVCPESIPVLRGMGFLATLTCYERPNLITRDPDCLIGLCRYNRDSSLTTAAFMQRALGAPSGG